MDEITWRDFILFVSGYRKRKVSEWEQTRFVAWMMYRMNTSDKHPKPLHKFLPLESDPKENRGEPLSDEQIQLILKMHSTNGTRNTAN